MQVLGGVGEVVPVNCHQRSPHPEFQSISSGHPRSPLLYQKHIENVWNPRPLYTKTYWPELFFLFCHTPNLHLLVNHDVNSPGAHVPSAVRCVVIHAVEQRTVNLRYIFGAKNRVWGSMGANASGHTHSIKEKKQKNSRRSCELRTWIKTMWQRSLFSAFWPLIYMQISFQVNETYTWIWDVQCRCRNRKCFVATENASLYSTMSTFTTRIYDFPICPLCQADDANNEQFDLFCGFYPPCEKETRVI